MTNDTPRPLNQSGSTDDARTEGIDYSREGGRERDADLRGSSRDDGGQQDTDLVLVKAAAMARRDDQRYHLPDADDPTTSRCRIDVEMVRKDRSTLLNSRELCRYCDLDHDTTGGPDGEMFASKVRDMDPDDLVTDGGQPEPYIDERDGLWIPPRFREFDSQVVFRTPRATIQHFGSNDLPRYYGMIDASHFGDPEEMPGAQNPDLAPDQLTIKPQGEPAETFTLDTEQEVVTDGGHEIKPDSWFVLDVSSDTVLSGPHETRRAASRAAHDGDRMAFTVASSSALSDIQEQTVLTWQNDDDVDALTGGGG